MKLKLNSDNFMYFAQIVVADFYSFVRVPAQTVKLSVFVFADAQYFSFFFIDEIQADVAAAAHLSIIDYLGDVPWEGYKNARLWYSKIKSRPAFKDILKDNIKGILPAKHYANLDF